MDIAELVKNATGPAIATDRQNRILSCNRLARELLGYSGPELVGKSLFEHLEAKDVFGNRLSGDPLTFWEMVSRGEAIRSFGLEARKASGEYQRVEVSVLVVLNGSPSQYQLVYLLRPILRRRKADEAIERILATKSVPDELIAEARSGNGKPCKETRLTPRQVEVLGYLSEGGSAEEIAKKLGVSVYTVRSHIQAILERMGVHSQVEAVARAFRDRII